MNKKYNEYQEYIWKYNGENVKLKDLHDNQLANIERYLKKSTKFKHYGTKRDKWLEILDYVTKIRSKHNINNISNYLYQRRLNKAINIANNLTNVILKNYKNNIK